MKIRTDKLWLRNTSRYDDRECMPLIRAAYASMVNSAGTRTVPRIIVKLTNCQWGFRGRAAWTEWHRDSDFQS